MPRTTRSKAAALAQEATEKDREPFDEVDANIKPPKSTRHTRSRSKKSIDTEEDGENAGSANALNSAEESSSNSPPSVVSSKSTRSTRSRSKKVVPAEVVEDEVVQVDTYEVTITRSTRSTRKAQKDIQQESASGLGDTVKPVNTNEPPKANIPQTTPRVTRTTRNAVKQLPSDEGTTTIRRTRRQAAKENGSENTPETDKPRTAMALATPKRSKSTSGSRIPSPAKTVAHERKEVSPSSTPVRPTSRGVQAKVPSAKKVPSSLVNRAPKAVSPSRPIVIPHLPKTPLVTKAIEPAPPLAKSPGKASQKVVNTTETGLVARTPSGPVLATTPIAMRVAALEQESRIRAAGATLFRASTIPASPSAKAEVVNGVTALTTPLRPVVPVSLSTIRRSKSSYDLHSKSPQPVLATPPRANAAESNSTPQSLRKVASQPALRMANYKPPTISTPVIKAPLTPATKVKPRPLDSPLVKPPTAKQTLRVASTTVSLGSFASPTKAHLARQSLAAATLSAKNAGSGEEGSASSSGTSMAVNVHKIKLASGSTQQTSKSEVPSLETMKRPAAVPAVLRKKAPVVSTTRAALLRAGKTTGKPTVEETTNAPATSTTQKSEPQQKPSETSKPRVAVVPTSKPVLHTTKSSAPAKPVSGTQTTAISSTTKPVSARPARAAASSSASSMPKKENTRVEKALKPVIPTISVTKPEAEGPKPREIRKTANSAQIKAAEKPRHPIVTAPQPKPDQPKASEATKPAAAKPTLQKKPFQPFKSTKPLTVPVPFQHAGSGKMEAQTGNVHPHPPKAQTAVSSIRDRINKFEAPKPKPKPTFVEARVLLREARKEARKGTLPNLTGEVEYAQLPDPGNELAAEKTAPIAPIATPVVTPIVVPQPIKPNLVRPVSPAGPVVTHDILVISGLERKASPTKDLFVEEGLDSLRKAKERAEASLRGHQAVL
ncbi:hypothetical protein ABW19_dt0200408 [Dactylella cylindrospora]|nr:hypothetical protein ABW19_dt0200408 [Dactylella cylindrospora]